MSLPATPNLRLARSNFGNPDIEQALRMRVRTSWEMYQAAISMARRSTHPSFQQGAEEAFWTYCWSLYRASQFVTLGTDIGEAPWRRKPVQ
jgi:hypothetical protein